MHDSASCASFVKTRKPSIGMTRSVDSTAVRCIVKQSLSLPPAIVILTLRSMAWNANYPGNLAFFKNYSKKCMVLGIFDGAHFVLLIPEFIFS
jgi:hypothetical protein